MNHRHTLILSIWFGYLFFVAYGSLLPLDFKSMPFDKAWGIFQHLQLHNLDVSSRADWIANVVLGIPTGLLTAQVLFGKFSKIPRAFLLIVSALFSFVFIAGIEFAQIFSPSRTCSLNDILAQSIGALIGLSLAAKYSNWFRSLLSAGYEDPRRLVLKLLEAYLALYVAFSLFPYDMLSSEAELEQKLRGDNWGWLLAGVGSYGGILIVIKLLFEIFLTIPFGIFLGYRSASRSANYKQAIVLGALLGSSIETAQFFMASGISMGLSILTRIVGVCCGLALWQYRATWTPERLAELTRRYTLQFGGIYVLMLFQVNGWFSHRWNAPDHAISRLGELHFMPFYYHYFTSEAKALFSVAIVGLMYLPIGFLTWANRGSPMQAFSFALLAAGVVETGKLFLDDMYPDPTNIMLGGVASWMVVRLARVLSGAVASPSNTETTAAQMLEVPEVKPRQRNSQLHKLNPVAGVVVIRENNWIAYTILPLSLAFTAYWAATFPTQPLLLSLFLAACAMAIWRQPVRLVALIPAALPVLDLASWSGRFYLDEFDLLMLVSLSIGYARVPYLTSKKRYTDTLFTLASGLVAISFSISAIRGLLPWQPPDANSFINYYSQYNSLRIVKGALWAFLSIGLLRRMVVSEMDIKRPLTIGMVMGLFLTVSVIFWERLTFSGLFNFSSDYRVTGPFSSMHTGGAYIECFLVIATPFLVLLVLQARNWAGRLLGGGLLLATTYALMVTFSRNGFAAFGIALAIILFFAIFKAGRWQQRGLLVTVLIVAMLAVAIPVFTGQFAQDRIATVGKDFAIRQAHWEDGLGIRSPDSLTTLFGMGLGRYPESHYLFSREENRSGTYQLMAEADNTFLRLVSGSSIYLGQRVSVKPQQKYVLKLDARTNKPDATITIPICEKWLLSSFGCMWHSFEIGKEKGAWHHFETVLMADQLSISHWYSQRPVKLALYNGNLEAIVDVDNIKLETIEGDNLIQNGDFSNALDHWFFTADSHLEWHLKSLPVSVIFDQGWFGLMAISLFSILAIKRAAGRAWRGDLGAAALLASFSGFLVVGLFDTLIDAPRFLFLFLVLGGFCGYRSATEPKERQHH